MRIILGIDPGQHGAIVALDGHAAPVASWLMPAAPRVGLDLGQLQAILFEARALGEHLEAVLERAQPMPRQGVSSTFAYGRDFGRLEALLYGACVPVELVTPATWHRQLVGGKRGDPKAEALALVRRRLPDLDLTPGRRRVPHDGIVDAACLALWRLERAPA
jgi:crossover junction endodeoxyribonuclease RuvC